VCQATWPRRVPRSWSTADVRACSPWGTQKIECPGSSSGYRLATPSTLQLGILIELPKCGHALAEHAGARKVYGRQKATLRDHQFSDEGSGCTPCCCAGAVRPASP
jgi:hypothetical protein